MDPWKSWAIVGVVGAGAAYYYSQSGKSRRSKDRSSPPSVERNQQHASPDPPSTTPAEKVKKRKGAKQQPSKPVANSAVDISHKTEADLEDLGGDDEETSNKEFAQHMSGLKKGTSLKRPDTTDKDSKRTRKQGKLKEMKPDGAINTQGKPNGHLDIQDISTTSSTTGADADDDMSLPVSPDLGATNATTPSGVDVSDMLEAPAKGPSILRIVQPESSKPARQPKDIKKAPEPETKKQRQRRQKNEEKKAEREQAEKERRILLEKQLRTAREAEGRPAKNGLSASKGPVQKAWDKSVDPSTGVASSTSERPSKSEDSALLDTFDDDKSFLGQPMPQANVEATNKAIEDDSTRNQDLPSEEEQIRIISEMDSDNTWNTVVKGGKGKKKSGKIATASGTSVNNVGNGAEISSDDLNGSYFGTDFTSAKSKTNSSNDPTTVSKNPKPMSSQGAEAVTSKSSQNGASKMNEGKITDHLTSNPKGKSLHPRPAQADTSTKIGAVTGIKSKAAENDHYKLKKMPPMYDSIDDDYGGTLPLSVSKHWRAIAENLDRNVWNHDNIREHPDFNKKWPFALTGHPSDSDWDGDWDSEDMRKGDEMRAEEDAQGNAVHKAGRLAQKEEDRM